MAEQDNITKLHRCVQRQFRELHKAVSRDHHKGEPDGWDVTETGALIDEFRPELHKLSLEAVRDARRIGIVAEVEPIITAITENQERLFDVALEASYNRLPGLPQVIDDYFPTLDRLMRVMATLTPEHYQTLEAPGQSMTEKEAEEEEGHLSVSQWAKRFEVSRSALDSSLRRWRNKNRGSDGWTEVKNRKANEPQFLYARAVVEPLIGEKRKRKR